MTPLTQQDVMETADVTLEVPTRHGLARAYVFGLQAETGTVIIGHGAGKGVNTPDIVGLAGLAQAQLAGKWRVIAIDQPWVVAGKRVASRPPVLDEAWLDVVSGLDERGQVLGDKLVFSGRSAGARVACRTAVTMARHDGETQAGLADSHVGSVDAVLALAFPLAPPKYRNVAEKWRSGEATAVVDCGIPLTILQGRTDTFGAADAVRQALPSAHVVEVGGGHSFLAKPDDVVEAGRAFLTALE